MRKNTSNKFVTKMIEAETQAIEKIQQNGNHAEDWLEFLTQYQADAKCLGDEACRHLVYLYGKAVNRISAENYRKNISYARLLVNFAQLQMRISEDEARSTFQLARNNAKHFAIVYVAWAQFELSTGNKSKCRSLLRKGKDFGAQPLELLRRAFDNLMNGNKNLLEGCQNLTENITCHTKDKSSDSSVESSPTNTGDESTTGTTDNGSCTVDNTSGVVSFKLPSVLNSRQQCKYGRSNSSSSDETDTALSLPSSDGVQSNHRPPQCSMSTQKPVIKSTPNFRAGTNSLAGCMNLSVRRKKTRRGLEGLGGTFGLPMRIKVALPEVEEPWDELDGIRELEATVHDSHQNTRPTSNEAKLASPKHEDQRAPCSTGTRNVPEPDSGLYASQLAECSSESVQQNQNKMAYQNDNRVDIQQHEQKPTQESSGQTGQQYALPVTTNSFRGSLSQQNSYNEQVGPRVYSGQPSVGGFVPGYPVRDQFVSPLVTVPQVPQETFVVNGHAYLKLETIGRGGSSKVFRAFDGKRSCAIKYVNLEEADDVIVQSYINEITLLKRLQGNDNIIKLFDWELNPENNTIILVMECGSIDLAGFLRKNRTKISEAELQGYWRQMLEAVHVTHEQGIIHSDLKPANFVLVEGRLKLIDFGIANALQGDKTSIERETQVGTLNFMSPEAFQDISHAPRMESTGNVKPRMKIGRASDVWSLGCILYMMVYGKTPFQHITNHIAKLQHIIDPSLDIEFPLIKNKHLFDVMKGCLRRAPSDRYTIPQLLSHPFLTSPSLDEDRFFDCLMEFAKVDVNSPRSIRAVSKSLCEQLLSGAKIQITPSVPRPSEIRHSQHVISSDQVPGPVGRHPLSGIDVQSLRQAQNVLKPPSMSGNSKNMRTTMNEQNKENADLDMILRRELHEKYRNAIPTETPDSTFEQSWNTTNGR